VPTASDAKEWKSGVKSGGANKKLTKDNSGGEKNHKHSKNCSHNKKQKKFYRKTTRYWKYSGADNQGRLEHITESESNYEPRDRYYKK
jgi:hypothetical protein